MQAPEIASAPMLHSNPTAIAAHRPTTTTAAHHRAPRAGIRQRPTWFVDPNEENEANWEKALSCDPSPRPPSPLHQMEEDFFLAGFRVNHQVGRSQPFPPRRAQFAAQPLRYRRFTTHDEERNGFSPNKEEIKKEKKIMNIWRVRSLTCNSSSSFLSLRSDLSFHYRIVAYYVVYRSLYNHH